MIRLGVARPMLPATTALVWGILCAVLLGQPSTGTSQTTRDFRSRHFLLTTDLPAVSAQRCLRKMERVLTLAEDYWGRSLTGQIRTYIVNDLEHWTADQFPTPNTLQVLRQVRGGTDLAAPQRQHRSARQAVVYAMNEPGVVEHEVVHAYCFQTFGRGGPNWYREGMAELFSQQVSVKQQAACRPETLQRIREAAPVTLGQVTRPGRFELSLAQILAASPGQDTGAIVQHDQHWPAAQPSTLRRARMAYAESWALCYFLHQHPDYQERFRSLGRHWLSGASVSLESAFAGRLPEIDFELGRFTQQLDVGYRFDLCLWHWSPNSRQLSVDRSVTVHIDACRGFQATQVQVLPGEEYVIASSGTWRVSADMPATNADGNARGQGRLEAVLLEQLQLTEPILLGEHATLLASQPGQLFLRCCDDWKQLADNRGTIEVRVTRVR